MAPEWISVESVSSIRTSGTRLKPFSGRLRSSPEPIWILKTKGVLYKDRFGKISFTWMVHPELDGRDWVVKSTLSFAPATNGSFANEKYREFVEEGIVPGKSNNVVFGIKEYVLEDEPRPSDPVSDVNGVIAKHADGLKKARKFWKRQLTEAKKQMLASEENMKEARELLKLAREILGRAEFSIGDIVVVKNKGREIEDVVEDYKLRGGKWVYELEKTKGQIPQEQLRWASRSRRAFQVPLGETSLAGMSKQVAKRNVNKLLSRYTRGLFRDSSWQAVHKIFDAMDAAQINWHMTDAEYRHNDQGVPTAKEWKFEIDFINNRDRKNTLYGIVVASGAGSVEDPLDRYDLVAYVS